MADEEFAAVPYGSEGVWRKLMHNARRFAKLEDVVTATKSKRYTRTRLDRMVMCAFLGITEEMMDSPSPYVRVLAFNDAGRKILRQKKETFPIVNAGESVDHPYWELEKRAGDLYGLFAADAPEPPGSEENRSQIESDIKRDVESQIGSVDVSSEERTEDNSSFSAEEKAA
jgi:hypothetical protein